MEPQKLRQGLRVREEVGARKLGPELEVLCMAEKGVWLLPPRGGGIVNSFSAAEEGICQDRLNCEWQKPNSTWESKTGNLLDYVIEQFRDLRHDCMHLSDDVVRNRLWAGFVSRQFPHEVTKLQLQPNIPSARSPPFSRVVAALVPKPALIGHSGSRVCPLPVSDWPGWVRCPRA